MGEAAKLLHDDVKYSHNLFHILSFFNPDKGEAKSYRSVIRWPKNLKERILFNTYCTQFGSCTTPENILNENDKFKVTKIFKTEKPNKDRIKLSSFSKDTQRILKDYYDRQTTYTILSNRIMILYEIQGDELILRTDPSILSGQDFKNYIEHKMVVIKNTKLTPINLDKLSNCCEKEKTEELEIPVEYDIFFGLDIIKGFPASDIQSLKDCLDQTNKDFFDGILDFRGSKDIRDKINNELIAKNIERKPGVVYNFEGLVGELFNNYKKGGGDFLSMINYDQSKFIGKALQIIPNDVPLISQPISSFQRDCRGLRFTLGDESTVFIKMGLACKIEGALLHKNTERSFLQYINYFDSINDKEEFQEFSLKFGKDGKLPEWIKEGRYRIGQMIKTDSQIKLQLYSLDWNESFEIILKTKGSEIVEATLTNNLDNINLFYYDRYLHVRHFTPTKLSILHEKANEILVIREHSKNQREFKLKKINELQEELIIALRKGENQIFLDRCLSHLIDNKFESITDASLLNDMDNTIPNFANKMNEIFTLSADKDVDEPATLEKILKELVIEGHYQKLNEKANALSVSEIMKLFANAEQYLKDIDGNDLILFIGGTGSGKSTSISFLLGHKMVSKYNKHHQKVWETLNNNALNSPKIGHMVGTSQTLFSQGFSIPGQTKLMFGDTPGLRDTRGDNYELCATLSFDQAIQRSNSIRAIVVTIPYETFLLDRGYPVVELMRTVDSLLPKLYSSNGNGVYILVTKHGSFQDIHLKTLIEEHCGKSDDSKEESIVGTSKKQIWDFLCKMQQAKKIERVDIPNEIRAEKLLEKYIKSPSIPKEDFTSLLQTESLKRKFAQHIQEATDTWSGIINKYIKIIPEAIKSTKTIIEEIKTSRDKNENQKNENIEKINQHQQTIDALKSEQEELSKHQSSGSKSMEGLSQAIKAKLNDNGKAFKEKTRISLLNDFGKCQMKIIDLNMDIGKLTANIHKYKSDIEKFNNRIKEIDKRLEYLNNGTELISLYQYTPDPNYKSKTCNVKPGAWEERFKKLEKLTEADCVNGKYDLEVSYSDYEGSFGHDVLIEKEFWIAPTDEKMRKAFEEHGYAQEGSRAYKAIITGEHYKPFLGRKVHPNGKLMIHSLETIWKKGRTPLPWFKIEHEIPRVDYFHSEITNLEAEKIELNKRIVFTNANMQPEIEQETLYKNNLKKEEELESSIKSRLSNLDNEIFGDGIEGVIKQNEKSIEDSIEFQKKLNEAQETLMSIIKTQNEEIERQEKEVLPKLLKEKRDLAIIIKTRWPIAQTLYKFAKLAVPQGKDKEVFQQTCKEFQDAFSTHEKAILSNCQIDLGFSC